MSPTSPCDLSIVVVSWNTRVDLERCLDSLQGRLGSLRTEIIVVDNASSDGSREMIAGRPNVVAVANDRNVGFAAACNQGLSRATGTIALLLNPDTVVESDVVVRLHEILASDDSVAVVGPRLVNADGSAQGGSAGYEPGPTAMFVWASLLHVIAPDHFGATWLSDRQLRGARRDVDWVSGACLMTRRSLVEQAGSLDERFFMYGEDIEWCRRLARAGGRVVCATDLALVHLWGRSTEQRGTGFLQQHVRGLDQFYRLRYSTAARLHAHVWGAVGFTWRALACAMLDASSGAGRARRRAITMWQCALTSWRYAFGTSSDHPGASAP